MPGLTTRADDLPGSAGTVANKCYHRCGQLSRLAEVLLTHTSLTGGFVFK